MRAVARCPLRARREELLRRGLVPVLSRWLSVELVNSAVGEAVRRQRSYPPWVVVWGLVLQAFGARLSERSVVPRLAVWLGQSLSLCSGAYGKARRQLSPAVPQRLAQGVAEAARRPVRGARGRRVVVLDTTVAQVADTPANAAEFGYPTGQQPGLGTPVMKFAVLMEASTGAPLAWSIGSWRTSDQQLAELLWAALEPGDIVVADRAYSSWKSLARLSARGIDLVTRQHQCRRNEPGRADHWELWPRPASVSRELPDRLPVRVLRGPAGRDSELVLNTTLDRHYSAKRLLIWYQQRWRIEGQFRQLKVAGRLEPLPHRSPQTVAVELAGALLALALLCAVRRDAAGRGDPWRLSLTVVIQALEAARGLPRRSQRTFVKRVVAQARNPDRPGREEPRARKRRPSQLPLLTLPRAEWKRNRAAERA